MPGSADHGGGTPGAASPWSPESWIREGRQWRCGSQSTCELPKDSLPTIGACDAMSVRHLSPGLSPFERGLPGDRTPPFAPQRLSREAQHGRRRTVGFCNRASCGSGDHPWLVGCTTPRSRQREGHTLPSTRAHSLDGARTGALVQRASAQTPAPHHSSLPVVPEGVDPTKAISRTSDHGCGGEYSPPGSLVARPGDAGGVRLV